MAIDVSVATVSVKTPSKATPAATAGVAPDRRMQAERESGSATAATTTNNVSNFNGTSSSGTEVATKTRVEHGCADSSDEDELPLLKRTTGVGSTNSNNSNSGGAGGGGSVGTTGAVVGNSNNNSNSTNRRHKKAGGGDSNSHPRKKSNASPPTMATWLKMEPQLLLPEENAEPMELGSGGGGLLVNGRKTDQPIKLEGQGTNEALLEEDLIDGFAVLSFRTIEDLQVRKKQIADSVTAIKRVTCFLTVAFKSVCD